MPDRENCLRAIRRQRPEWVPQEYKCIKLVNPACLLDRVDDGVDWFGVRWRETVPEVGERLLPDITKWREIIYFPDLEALDWEGCARRELDGYDREEKLLWIPQRPGPFERLHSFMGFEDALLSMYTEPEALAALISAYVDFRIRCIDLAP
jgi:hypothetical protein